ncbi:MAG: DNA-binding response regulator [Verrucomicrobiales bacterium]|nr:DNA-binding response regulator [Verrucomicrobiales bacterium]
MRLLLVEDSERLQRFVAIGLREAGYAVDVTSDGAEGLWMAESNSYDVIVLDIMLPSMDGLTILENLRRKDIRTHVLLLTARDTVDDRVLGLRKGADDYLIKPFAFEEFLARIGVLCRRNYGQKSPILRVGALEVNTTSKSVQMSGAVLELSPREYALLEYLLCRRGAVVSRSEIEEHIYDDCVEPLSNVVDSAICNLRKKLADLPDLIQTRRGIGYIIPQQET